MDAIIDVELAVDTQSLINVYPALSRDPDHPTVIAGGCCFLFGAESSVSQGQASDHLSLSPPTVNGHVLLRLRAVSLSGNSDTAAVIYKVLATPHADKHKPVLGAFAPHEVPVDTPLPTLIGGSNTDPPSFTVQTVTNYFLQSQLTRPGRLDLQICFYLTAPNQTTGAPECVGYCVWPTRVTFVPPVQPDK